MLLITFLIAESPVNFFKNLLNPRNLEYKLLKNFKKKNISKYFRFINTVLYYLLIKINQFVKSIKLNFIDYFFII